MAAPNVTGSLLLLQEHYENIHGVDSFMRSATLKALAIHTADESGADDGPDYAFGWGLLNTRMAAKVISEDGGGDHQIIEASLANGAEDSYQFSVSTADSVLSATLVWMDPPGTPVDLALDAPDPMLVNDLDLRITRGPSTYMPWVLNPAVPSAAATTGDNDLDNVEQVEVSGGGTGTYTIRVNHEGTLLNSENQNYSLIISVTPALPTGSGLLIDEDFSGGMPAGWSVETASGISWAIKSPVPGNTRLDNGTGGTGKFAMVDNNYSNTTFSSLRMPTLDLSAATAVVLRFNSYFIMDLYESLNVDISTDGGTIWNNAWMWQGFNPFPTLYTLDLTGVAAGYSSVSIRFRYDSEFDYTGDLWQVDNVQLDVFGAEPPPGDPPGQATAPSPANGSNGLALNTTVSWSAGSLTTSHDVYFGTDSTPDVGESQGNQSGTAFDPGLLLNSTTYYWRVDEVNAEDTTPGNIWSFTTEPAPVPAGTINLSSLSGSMTPGSRGRWNAIVEISVEDQDNGPSAGVTVDGNWSNGANGSGQCITNGAGLCSVAKNNMKKQVASVTFAVTNLTGTGSSYSPADNVGSNSIIVSQSSVDNTPTATDDSFQTDVDLMLSENVISNDNQGDGPASINSNTSPSSGSLSMSGNGSFTYTPDADFVGVDSFDYSMVDQDGDISNTATVTITVTADPPPPPSGDPTVSLRPYKVKGVQHVDVTWENFAGTTVTITRDGFGVNGSPANNEDGFLTDNIGSKGGGQYTYEVCEPVPGICVSANTGF